MNNYTRIIIYLLENRVFSLICEYSKKCIVSKRVNGDYQHQDRPSCYASHTLFSGLSKVIQRVTNDFRNNSQLRNNKLISSSKKLTFSPSIE